MKAKRKTKAKTQSKRKPARQYFVLPGRTHDLPFSDAVLVGETLYVCGHVGMDAKTGKIAEGIEQEVRCLLENFRHTLAAAGMTMDDLVFVQVFCPDVSLFSQFNAVYRTYFKKDFPARAFLGSGPLLFGAHFELQGIAVRSDR